SLCPDPDSGSRPRDPVADRESNLAGLPHQVLQPVVVRALVSCRGSHGVIIAAVARRSGLQRNWVDGETSPGSVRMAVKDSSPVLCGDVTHYGHRYSSQSMPSGVGSGPQASGPGAGGAA